MSLLDEIRSDLTNQSANLSNTLRKAKILASRIGLDEFREWVDSELSGYSDRDKLPSYRKFRPTNLGTYYGPSQQTVENAVLPTFNLPDPVRDFAEKLMFFDGVGALEAQGGEDSQIKWPQEMVMLARDSVKLGGGFVLADAHQPVPAYLVTGILDQVKNKLLDFILALEENNVTAEDLDNQAVATEVARNLFHIYVYGDRNIVATGEQVDQRVTTVQEGNIESLLSCLRSLNIPDDDLKELQEAITTEPSASEGGYGPKVKAWLGGMVAKVTTGVWKVGIETGTKALTEALNGFYGLC